MFRLRIHNNPPLLGLPALSQMNLGHTPLHSMALKFILILFALLMAIILYVTETKKLNKNICCDISVVRTQLTGTLCLLAYDAV